MSKISMLDEYNQEHLVDAQDLVDRASAYGILIKKGKVLLVKDSKSQTWEFPGGGLDKDETKEEGVIREFLEETGLQVNLDSIKFFTDIQDYFYSSTYETLNFHKKILALMAKLNMPFSYLVSSNMKYLNISLIDYLDLLILLGLKMESGTSDYLLRYEIKDLSDEDKEIVKQKLESLK